MKTLFTIKFLFLLTASVFVFSCESHEKKADSYVRSKYSIKVAEGEKTTNIKKEVKPTEQKRTVKVLNEWQQFKLDTEKKIRLNEKEIERLKSHALTTQKMTRKLTDLEEANNDLKIQLKQFNEEVIVKWENFKTSMNHDVNEIGLELDDISTK